MILVRWLVGVHQGNRHQTIMRNSLRGIFVLDVVWDQSVVCFYLMNDAISIVCVTCAIINMEEVGVQRCQTMDRVAMLS